MPPRNILIVEDDVDLRDNIVEYLTLENFTVTGTGCALDFYQSLGAGVFNVAIVDIGLPDRSGLEIVKHLRQHTRLGVIILTARDGMSDKLRGYELGADYYLVKPISSAELVVAINDLINRLGVQISSSNTIGASDSWSLDLEHWLLVCPEGSKTELTTKEISFLQSLIAANDSEVPRQVLLQKLGYHQDGPYGSRSLDVMIVRLRKKIKAVSGCSPIKTVHGVGYSFSAKARQL